MSVAAQFRTHLDLSRSRSWVAIGAALVATLLAVVVQREILGVNALKQVPTYWAIAGGIGLIAWLLTGRFLSVETPPSSIAVERHRANIDPIRRWIVIGTGVTASVILLIALVLLYRSLHSTVGAWLWLLGLSGIIVAGWQRDRWMLAPAPVVAFDSKRARARLFTALAAAGVVLIAFAARTYQLVEIPGSLNNDEGEIGDAALGMFHMTGIIGQHIVSAVSPFQTLAFGSTPLGYIYLHALVMQVAGENTWGLRVMLAICGTIEVAIVYRFLRDHVAAWAAIAAALLLTVSHNHLFWTRTAQPQAMLSVVTVALVWLLIRGLTRPGFLPWIVAGMLIGGSQHVYQGSRIVIPIVGLFIIAYALVNRRLVAERWRHILIMGLCAIAVFAPLGFWYLVNPQELTSRANSITIIFNQDYLRGVYPGMTQVEVAIEQMRKSLLGFGFTGDGSGAFYPMRAALVDPVVGAITILGILGVTISGRHPERLLVAIWFWLTALFTCALTLDPPPMTRLFVVWPALYFMVGIILARYGAVFTSRLPTLGKWIVAAPFGGAIAFGLFWNVNTFFVDYPRALPPGVWTVAGQAVREAGLSTKTYMLGPPHLYFYNSAMRFLTRGRAGDDIQEDGLPVQERGYRDGMFIVTPALPNALARLRSIYPNGQPKEYKTWRNELLFTTYKVEARTLFAPAGPTSVWKQFDKRFGSRGAGFGQFDDPRALATDAAGQVYVADRGNGRIDVFDANGKPTGVIGRPGTGPGEFRTLWGVAIGADGTVLGLDRDARAIQRFSTSGHWLGQIGGPEIFQMPVAMAVALDGRILVADLAANAVIRLDPFGAPIDRIATRGSGPGQIDGPSGVAVAADGTIYVADSKNARIERFSDALAFQGEWPIPRIDPNAGPALAVADGDGGAVYVVDPSGGQVLRFRSDGQKEWSIGTRGDGPLNFMVPLGVATDQSGNVYVLDTQRHLVSRFDVSKRTR